MELRSPCAFIETRDKKWKQTGGLQEIFHRYPLNRITSESSGIAPGASPAGGHFPGSPDGSPDTGKVVIFFGEAFHDTLTLDERDVEIAGEQSRDYFGYLFVSIGDVNHDQIDDILVTAPGYRGFAGRATIFFGGDWPSTLAADQADIIVTLGSEPYSEFLGASGSITGDFNGDGISDLVLGANYGNDVGQVFLFWGPLQAGVLPADSADVHILGENADNLLGMAPTGKGIAAADVNGDGKDDLIVGAYGYDGSGNNVGRVYIFYGDRLTSGTTIRDANVVITGKDTPFSNDFGFGSSIVTGDVDGDGKADLLIGEFGDDLQPAFIGTYYLFLGNSLRGNMSAEDANWTVTGTQSQQFFAERWSALGDLNGDGRADIVLGSPRTNAVYVFTHPLLGQHQLTEDADLIIEGNTNQKIANAFTGTILGTSADQLLLSGIQYLSTGDSVGIVTVYDVTKVGITKQVSGNQPVSLQLFQNYPNPFNAATTIRYELPKAQWVRLKIVDLLGSDVCILVNGRQSAGEKSVVWNGRDRLGREVRSGIYIGQIRAGGFSASRKMVLLK